jgi:hypothetical protein
LVQREEGLFAFSEAHAKINIWSKMLIRGDRDYLWLGAEMKKEIWVYCCGDLKFEHDFWEFVRKNGISYSGQMGGYPASPDQFLTGCSLIASTLSIVASLAKIYEWQIAQRKRKRKGKITIKIVKKPKGTLDIETADDEIEVIARNINELTVKSGKKPRKRQSTKKKGKTRRTKSPHD